MSERTRAVTPRLQAAITSVVSFLDTLVDLSRPPQFSPMQVDQYRAELLEAFDEATSERDASLGPARVERLER